MAVNAALRLNTILEHIKSKVPKRADGKKPVPCCILLQEVATDAFSALLHHAWVREHFQVVPTSPSGWPAGASYGVVTLVSRTLRIAQTQSLEFGSSFMGRSALMVDILMNPDSWRENGERVSVASRSDDASSTGAEEMPDQEVVTVRVANTHLESLPVGAVARPVQLAGIAELLREADCGVVCGDMNAIGPSDNDIHIRAGLEDAWTRGDKDAVGYTWGYQPRCEYPVGRLDKVLYTPGEGLEVEEPQRVGVGLKTAGGQWASDHYGLTAVVKVVSL